MNAITLAVVRSFASQQFKEALQVAVLLVDPIAYLDTNEMYDLELKCTSLSLALADFSRFKRISFYVWSRQEILLNDLIPEFETTIKERQSHGILVYATARGRPATYMK